MTRSSKQGSKQPKNTRKMAGTLAGVHSELKQLVELQRQAENKFVPETPDIPRIRFKQDTIFNVEFTFNQQTAATSTTTPVNGSLPFLLSAFPNYNIYTAAFDLYRIIQVNVKIMPTTTAVLASSSVTGPYIYTVIDYDDATALTSESSYLSYPTCKITPPNQIDERTLVPRIDFAAYSGAFTSYAQAKANQWIDCNSPTVQHYGIKYFVSTSPVAENIRFLVTLMVQFKGVRSGT